LLTLPIIRHKHWFRKQITCYHTEMTKESLQTIALFTDKEKTASGHDSMRYGRVIGAVVVRHVHEAHESAPEGTDKVYTLPLPATKAARLPLGTMPIYLMRSLRSNNRTFLLYNSQAFVNYVATGHEAKRWRDDDAPAVMPTEHKTHHGAIAMVRMPSVKPGEPYVFYRNIGRDDPTIAGYGVQEIPSSGRARDPQPFLLTPFNVDGDLHVVDAVGFAASNRQYELARAIYPE
jgi:hypothetical protein